MKKEAILVITALVLSAATAWANGINSFTLAGTVEGFYCAEYPTASKPYPGCFLEIADTAASGRFITSVGCDDPSVAEACRWLKPGDPVLILGDETPFGKTATHVALLLHGSTLAQENKRIEDPRSDVFQLRLGQSLEAGGLRIRFRDVIEDSRCPEDVVCAWEGRVTVAIEVRRATAASLDKLDGEMIYLTLGAEPDPEREVDGRFIRLAGVLPVPRTDRPGELAGYSILFSVTGGSCEGSLWCPPVR